MWPCFMAFCCWARGTHSSQYVIDMIVTKPPHGTLHHFIIICLKLSNTCNNYGPFTMERWRTRRLRLKEGAFSLARSLLHTLVHLSTPLSILSTTAAFNDYFKVFFSMLWILLYVFTLSPLYLTLVMGTLRLLRLLWAFKRNCTALNGLSFGWTSMNFNSKYEAPQNFKIKLSTQSLV